MLDSHIYLAFNNNIIEMQDENDILAQSCDQAIRVDFMQEREMPTIVGEWSNAVDDCAKYLNGFHTKIRKEELGRSCQNNFTKNFYRELAKNQLWAFEQAEGWMFWNFKNELEDDWSWFRMVELEWVPRDAREIPEFIKDATCANKNFLSK